MARINNAITFGSGFNITASGPIDSRTRVEYVTDLTLEATWPSDKAPVYDGLTVIVTKTPNDEPLGELWTLPKASKWNVLEDLDDPDTYGGWKKVGKVILITGSDLDS
jgi:hypothetical protein